MACELDAYLDTLLTKAVDESAARIEFVPADDGGCVRYFERGEVCHELSLPESLHKRLVEHILDMAHLSFTRDALSFESWLRVATEERSRRVHVSAQRGPEGPLLRLTF